ncbi:MAG: hypothetical protein AAF960_24320 [Bacteroidota bacterium]
MKNFTTFVLSLLFFLIVFNAHAQRSGGYIGASFGTAVPIGTFAKNEIRHSNGGLATSGGALNLIDFGYKFNRNLGIAASVGGAYCNMGHTSLSSQITYGGFFIGPAISLPLGRCLDFTITPKVGTTSAAYNIREVAFVEEKGIGYELGVSLHYNVGRKWHIFFDNAYSQADYGDNFRIMSFNSKLGLAFRLR